MRMHRFVNTVKLGFVVSLGALAITLPHQLVAQNSGTPSTFAVTDAGAATYNIPLYSAPSAGGMDVKLSLQYNSQSPNGVFGVGWSLSGVSAITRCPKTPAEEGVREGVKNDTTDIFCLDGQKLRKVGGTAGAYHLAGSEYRTAIDSYSKIIANGTQGNGPQSFTVYTKAGAILEFGGTDASRLEHPGKSNTVRVWMVSQIRDRFSNAGNNNATAINFNYLKNTTLGEQLLDTVRHNNGQIKLIYEARPANDHILKFDDGIQLGSTQSRVSRIEVYDEPQVSGARQLRLFKEYRLAYIQSQATYRSLVTSIQECAAGGSACLPAATYGYRGFNPASFTTISHPDLAKRTTWAMFAGMFDHSGIYRIKTAEELEQLVPPLGEGIRLQPHVIWDINGDGLTDIIAAPESWGSGVGWPAQSTIHFHSNPAGQHSVVSYSHPAPGNTLGPMCFADVNGDGVSEPLYFRNNGEISWLSVFISGTEYSSAALPNFAWGIPTSKCQPVDLDGDGRAEVVFEESSYGSSWIAYRFNGTNLISTSERGPLAWPWVANTLQAYNGDFNGDGKTDRLTFANPPVAAASWAIQYAAGGGGTPLRLDHAPSVWVDQVYCAGDFNGDGRTDLLVHRSTTGLNTARLWLATGSGFVEQDTTLPRLGHHISCGDFNGDGLTDVLHWNTLDVSIWSQADGGAVDYMITANNGLGLQVEFEHGLTTDTNLYSRGSGASFPWVDISTPIAVVKRSSSKTGAAGWNTTQYRYEALRADLHRRGTLGFAKVTSIHDNTGISLATNYHQAWPFTGMKQRILKTRSGVTLEDSTYTYAQRGYNGAAPNAQFAQVHQTQSVIQRKDLNGAFLAWESEEMPFAQIDSFGNPLSSVQTHFDASGSPTSRKATTQAYTNNSATWLIGQLTQSSTRSENLRSLPTTQAGANLHATSQSLYNAFALSVNPMTLTASRLTPGTISASATVTASGASEPVSFSWSKVQGNRIVIVSANSVTPSFSASVSLGENFTETIRVTATDADGRVSSRDLAVNFATPAALNITTTPLNTLVANRTSPGTLIGNASASTTGGTGPYTYAWSKLSGNRIGIGNATSANASFSASVGWNENFTEQARVVVTDSVGNSTSRTLSLNFTSSAPPPLSVSLPAVGGLYIDTCSGYVTHLNLSAQVSGGTGGYQYTWTTSPAWMGAYISSQSGNNAVVRVTNWGQFFVQVVVTDSFGNTKTSNSTAVGAEYCGNPW